MKPRSILRLPAVLLLAVLFPANASTLGSQTRANPARYLYVWAGSGNDTTKGVDVVTVLDANPSSPNYGKVLAALTVDSAGRMPHHTELVLPPKGPFFANDYSGNKSFLVDFSNPTKPRLAGRVDVVPGGRKLHSFARLANGHVIATVQFSDSSVAGSPGMLAEFDAKGKLIRSGSARDPAFPGARIRTYSLMPLPLIDRIVTTSNPMDNEDVAQVVQVWRLSDLKLLKTIAMPPSPAGDSSYRYPFELHALPGGRSVMLNTYACAFFTLTHIDSNPRLEHVLSLQQPRDFGCSVPVVEGNYMVMPIAYGHRYATLDISDPAHLKEVASFPTDTTFFPHWASPDPGSDRLVFTDQGDGQARVMIAHFDRATGRLAWDEKFRDAGSTTPGVSYHRDRWPNGLTGMLMPHGALFVP
jgi:LVIVD repeat